MPRIPMRPHQIWCATAAAGPTTMPVVRPRVGAGLAALGRWRGNGAPACSSTCGRTLDAFIGFPPSHERSKLEAERGEEAAQLSAWSGLRPDLRPLSG
eukprot:scaffold26677_cov109-Isochrysis_galbana.AAC.2